MSITPWPYRPQAFLSPFINTIRSVFYGIRNLIYWFPLIWQDRNYHYQYLFRILRHKLFDMEHMLRKEGLAVDSEHSARQLHLCVALLDRLIADKYESMSLGCYDNEKGTQPLKRMKRMSMLKKTRQRLSVHLHGKVSR